MPFVKNIFSQKDLVVVLFLLAIIAIIIVPLPSYLLDFFLTISIALSVLIILIGLYIKKPTDFSAFPTLLLMVTLFRLALNVATTRMILSNGHLGIESVSSIISSFGQFVVGGNYVIGIIVFAILVIVNYLVITNGSTRVAEVQARFTLEAMPGKQMAIDADLNSGLIDKDEAQKRREILMQEADFYGAMDGASKFVKGDAIAGIIITFVNIIGGFLIGTFGNDMSIAESASVFTILTIGDGLVSQIPALIVSTATGIVITRATKSEDGDFASGIVRQLLGNSKILLIVGAMLLFFALIPGLPTLSLGFVGVLFLLMSYLLGAGVDNVFNRMIFKKSPTIQKQAPMPPKSEVRTLKSIREHEEQLEQKHQAVLDANLRLEVLKLSIGYNLVKLAEFPDSPLIERIRGMRANIAQTFGFIIPKINIQADPSSEFPINGYKLFLKGVQIGGGEVMVDKYLAMDLTGMVSKEIVDGIPVKEPVYNSPAYWINKEDKDDATIAGYTVVDASVVISVHLDEMIKFYADEILTRQDVKNLIERLREKFPSLVADCEKIPLGVIHQVLKELLHCRIPIKDLLTILETIVEIAPKVQNNVPIIMDYVRSALSRVITDTFKSDDGKIKFFTLPKNMEDFLLSKLQDTQLGRRLVLSLGETQNLIKALDSCIASAKSMHIMPILLVEMALRSPLAVISEKNNIPLTVLANAEISANVEYELLGEVEFNI